MLTVVSQNPAPVINQIQIRRYATSETEAEEIFSETSKGGDHFCQRKSNALYRISR